jgi:hypothetical protein
MPDSDQQQTVTLAPAAGAGIGKMLADALLASPGFLELMQQTAIDGLNAMTGSRWDKTAGEFVRDPDYRTRAQMFFGLLAHMEGEPVKRIIHQHLGNGAGFDPLAALQGSPALREAARQLLAKSEWRQSGRNAKQAESAEPVDAG